MVEKAQSRTKCGVGSHRTLGVCDTLSDSIQYLNFAKKRFIQYSIQYCFNQDSIQNIIQFKINSGDSIQNTGCFF